MTTGQKIYELRKNARITQEQFAEKLDVSRQAVSKWESDAAYPETDKIIKIAELFGVSCDYLLKSDAEQNDDVLSKRRRAFLTMLISFAVVSAVVGYVVAVICYYCIDMRESPLIGFGVLAAFLLAAFILWSDIFWLWRLGHCCPQRSLLMQYYKKFSIARRCRCLFSGLQHAYSVC